MFSMWIYGGLKHYALLGYEMHCNSVEHNTAMNRHRAINFSSWKCWLISSCMITQFWGRFSKLFVAGKHIPPLALILWEEMCDARECCELSGGTEGTAAESPLGDQWSPSQEAGNSWAGRSSGPKQHGHHRSTVTLQTSACRKEAQEPQPDWCQQLFVSHSCTTSWGGHPFVFTQTRRGRHNMPWLLWCSFPSWKSK